MSITTGVLTSGGVRFDSVFVRCKVQASRKPDEVIVTLDDVPGVVTSPVFFVDPILVRTTSVPSTDSRVDGTLEVLLLEDRGSDVLIEVPGEPATYGPKLLVPREMVT